MDQLGSHVFSWPGTVALGVESSVGQRGSEPLPQLESATPVRMLHREKNRHLHVFAKNFLPLDLGPYEQSKVRKSWTWDQETRGQV